MMVTRSRPKARIPKLCYDRRGYPRVCLSGVWVSLGKAEDPDLELRYHKTIARWIDNGRRWPPPEDQPAAVGNIAQLGRLYLAHCRTYYVKRDKPTTTVGNVDVALRILARARMAQLHVLAMTPSRLKKLQRMMLKAKGSPWSAQTINRYLGIVIKMYRWAGSEGLVPATRWQELQAVEKLRRGRAPSPGTPRPRGRRKVTAVPEAHLAATMKHLAPVHRAMVGLQLVAAMRPMEVCGMRGRDLYKTADPDVTAYVASPEADKLEHRRDDDDEAGRVVYIGPKGRAIIDAWIGDNPEDFVFRPGLAEREAFDRRAALATGAAPARHRFDGRGYAVTTYRRIIERACERACDELGLEGDARWTWSPRQLRHNGGTELMEREGIEIASRLMGHTTIRTTTIYAKVRDKISIAAAKRVS
jgi:integrase